MSEYKKWRSVAGATLIALGLTACGSQGEASGKSVTFGHLGNVDCSDTAASSHLQYVSYGNHDQVTAEALQEATFETQAQLTPDDVAQIACVVAQAPGNPLESTDKVSADLVVMPTTDQHKFARAVANVVIKRATASEPIPIGGYSVLGQVDVH